jgi:hypothetical protein
MKIIKAKVEWMEEFDNEPSLRIMVDKEPDYAALRYEKRGDLYFAQQGVFASFFYYSKPGEGYGGREFPIKLLDGTDVILKGPWSSNSASMNEAGFTPTKECAYTADKETWKRGYTFYSGIITLDAWRDAVKKFCKDADVVEVRVALPFSKEASCEQNIIIGSIDKTTICYKIARKGMTFDQSQAFKRAKRHLKTIKAYNSGKSASWWRTQEEKEKARLEFIASYNDMVKTHNLNQFGLPSL